MAFLAKSFHLACNIDNSHISKMLILYPTTLKFAFERSSRKIMSSERHLLTCSLSVVLCCCTALMKKYNFSSLKNIHYDAHWPLVMKKYISSSFQKHIINGFIIIHTSSHTNEQKRDLITNPKMCDKYYTKLKDMNQNLSIPHCG